MKTKPYKIGNRLRNVLMGQNETLMLAKDKAIYFDEVYSFNPFTPEEREALRMKLLKDLDKKSWVEQLINNLFR